MTGHWHFALLPDVIWILWLQYMQLLLVSSLDCKEGFFPPFCIFISRTLILLLLSSCCPPQICSSEEWELVTPPSQAWRALWGYHTCAGGRELQKVSLFSLAASTQIDATLREAMFLLLTKLSNRPAFSVLTGKNALSSRPTSVMCLYPNSGLFVLAPAVEYAALANVLTQLIMNP